MVTDQNSDDDPFEENYTVKIKSGHKKGHDTCTWKCASMDSRYDAIHAVAGALLAGAESVTVVREETNDG